MESKKYKATFNCIKRYIFYGEDMGERYIDAKDYFIKKLKMIGNEYSEIEHGCMEDVTGKVNPIYQTIGQKLSVRDYVMSGLKQIKEGKTTDFDEVCNRLENKYRNVVI